MKKYVLFFMFIFIIKLSLSAEYKYCYYADRYHNFKPGPGGNNKPANAVNGERGACSLGVKGTITVEFQQYIFNHKGPDFRITEEGPYKGRYEVYIGAELSKLYLAGIYQTSSDIDISSITEKLDFIKFVKITDLGDTEAQKPSSKVHGVDISLVREITTPVSVHYLYSDDILEFEPDIKTTEDSLFIHGAAALNQPLNNNGAVQLGKGGELTLLFIRGVVIHNKYEYYDLRVTEINNGLYEEYNVDISSDYGENWIHLPNPAQGGAGYYSLSNYSGRGFNAVRITDKGKYSETTPYVDIDAITGLNNIRTAVVNIVPKDNKRFYSEGDTIFYNAKIYKYKGLSDSTTVVFKYKNQDKYNTIGVHTIKELKTGVSLNIGNVKLSDTYGLRVFASGHYVQGVSKPVHILRAMMSYKLKGQLNKKYPAAFSGDTVKIAGLLLNNDVAFSNFDEPALEDTRWFTTGIEGECTGVTSVFIKKAFTNKYKIARYNANMAVQYHYSKIKSIDNLNYDVSYDIASNLFSVKSNLEYSANINSYMNNVTKYHGHSKRTIKWQHTGSYANTLSMDINPGTTIQPVKYYKGIINICGDTWVSGEPGNYMRLAWIETGLYQRTKIGGYGSIFLDAPYHYGGFWYGGRVGVSIPPSVDQHYGIDCSGFVTQAYRLSIDTPISAAKYNTTQLNSNKFSDKITKLSDVRPGDIYVKPGHVVIITEVFGYDTSPQNKKFNCSWIEAMGHDDDRVSYSCDKSGNPYDKVRYMVNKNIYSFYKPKYFKFRRLK